MSQKPEKKRRSPRVLLACAALLALCIVAIMIGVRISRIHDDASQPLVFEISLLCAALVAGLFTLGCRLNTWRRVRLTLLTLAVLITLVAIFYSAENWRGKRAWENARRKLEAAGVSLDWNALIPPPVPDDQNVFKAPGMEEFAGDGPSELSKQMHLQGFTRSTFAEVLVSTPQSPVAPEAGDINLSYSQPFLTIGEPHTNESARTATILPLIEIKDEPLTSVISTLARQAEIRYAIDPRISFGQPGPDGKPVPQPTVSIRWENITARKALLALLANYGLLLIENPDGPARIVSNDHLRVIADDAATDQLVRLIKNAEATNAAIVRNSVRNLKGSLKSALDSAPLVSGSVDPIRPVRIVVRATEIPWSDEVKRFFPAAEASRISVTESSNSFRVSLKESNTVRGAVDYLSWSDQLEPDFDRIREALKRPCARMPGDYSEPTSIPFPNFIRIRVVAQRLADRAKCHLLAGQPDDALRDVTLINDLRQLVLAKPTGKPMTLVAAMINVAVTGVYLDTITDGFRLQAWREPQLLELQQQLQQIELAPPVMDALQEERVRLCRNLETLGLGKFLLLPYTGPPDQPYDRENTWKEKLSEWRLRSYDLAPRGWVYQNMATIATLTCPGDTSFDPVRNVIVPGASEQFVREITALAHHAWPYGVAAMVGIPNYTRALQYLARTQTLANEALIACALERYRLANGPYPDSLDGLAPKFLEKIPHDLIGGEPLKYRRIASAQNSNGESFLLYSIGWNETDDGGQVVPEKAGSSGQSFDHGDWVWGVPTRQ
jgi:hypothetical protein